MKNLFIFGIYILSLSLANAQSVLSPSKQKAVSQDTAVLYKQVKKFIYNYEPKRNALMKTPSDVIEGQAPAANVVKVCQIAIDSFNLIIQRAYVFPDMLAKEDSLLELALKELRSDKSSLSEQEKQMRGMRISYFLDQNEASIKKLVGTKNKDCSVVSDAKKSIKQITEDQMNPAQEEVNANK